MHLILWKSLCAFTMFIGSFCLWERHGVIFWGNMCMCVWTWVCVCIYTKIKTTKTPTSCDHHKEPQLSFKIQPFWCPAFRVYLVPNAALFCCSVSQPLCCPQGGLTCCHSLLCLHCYIIQNPVEETDKQEIVLYFLTDKFTNIALRRWE